MSALKQAIYAGQSITLSPIFQDQQDNVYSGAVLATPPTWHTNDTDKVSLTLSKDGLSCIAKPLGPLGVATISMSFSMEEAVGGFSFCNVAFADCLLSC